DIRFFDVGALVWFARIIEWEFPGFSVESCLERLLAAQTLLEKTGSLCAKTHRIFLQAVKETN
ncbi:MAG: SAM-dependent methyltransferase, partial [Clostridia bacterium]|nr:SAM-dependent methyltransferase [Clostridia bacterium]